MRAQCITVRSIRTVRRHAERASHYYIRAQCVTVRSIRTVRRHTERACHYDIRAQCLTVRSIRTVRRDTVRSIRTIRTAREAHSNCNIPRSINHKPTQAQKPRKAHSKCNIPRSINYKPTQAQKPRKAHSKCNIPRSINHKPTQAQKPRKAHSMRCDLPTVKHSLQTVYPCCRSVRSVRIDTWLIRTVTVRVYWTTLVICTVSSWYTFIGLTLQSLKRLL